MKKLSEGITMDTIFASGRMGPEIYMSLRWVLENGNIRQAIVQTEANIAAAKAYKDLEFQQLEEKSC